MNLTEKVAFEPRLEGEGCGSHAALQGEGFQVGGAVREEACAWPSEDWRGGQDVQAQGVRSRVAGG